MDYQLLILIASVIVLTIGYAFLVRYVATRNIKESEVTDTLDITKSILNFAQIILKKNVQDSDKLYLYSELVLEAIEYIKVLSADLPKEVKLDMGMESIKETSIALNVKISIDEYKLIKSVLTMSYDMMVSLKK